MVFKSFRLVNISTGMSADKEEKTPKDRGTPM
jgi:hypothetical protein